jgi:Icc-related predicted phosphoesterase
MGDITCTELHPYICVYNNVFSDTDSIYQVIKQSEELSEKKTTYLNWSNWHIFGTYSYCRPELDIPLFEEDETLTKERNVLKEIRDCRKNVLDLYCKKYNVQLPENSFIENIMTALKYFPDIDSAQGHGPPSNKTME